jgi:hypothetical protein
MAPKEPTEALSSRAANDLRDPRPPGKERDHGGPYSAYGTKHLTRRRAAAGVAGSGENAWTSTSPITSSRVCLSRSVS